LKEKIKNTIIGNGEMAGLIRKHDWSSTLGAIEQWPGSLITSVNIILQSPVPIVMLWGKDGIMIYNDGYSVFAGGKHPGQLGCKVEEGWPEVAEFNRNVMVQGLAGKTLSYKDQTMTLYRNEVPEEVSMDLNYSPIIDESGKPAGVLAIVVETTQRVIAEKKQKTLDEALLREQHHLRDLFMHAPSFISVLKGPTHVFELANSLYMLLVGKGREIINKPVAEALPEVVDQGFIKILDDVYNTGTPFISEETSINLDRKGNGALESVYVNFIYQPTKDAQGNITGIFVQGIDVTDVVISKKRAEDQNKVLEMITSGSTLTDTLDYLIHSIEKRSAKGMKASISLVDNDGERLLHGAAPSLPETYNKVVHGIAIGMNIGSCGTAAYLKESVEVSDIEHDPLWKDYKDLALSHNLRSCWSTPILSVADRRLLGTFALYYDKPHLSTEEDKMIVNFAIRTAALVIDRSQAEEKLKEREEYFRVIADNMQNLAWMMNTDGYRTWYNKQWYSYTGLTEKESLGFGWKKAHATDSLEKVEALIKTGLEQNEVFELTIPLKDANNKFRRFLTRVYPIKDAEGNILRWIGTNTDIEEQENTTEKLETLVEKRTKELMLSNEDLQQFAHVASHDLKEPIRKIKTFVNLIQSKFSSHIPDEGKEYFKKVQNATDRVGSMIDGVLLYSSISSYESKFEKIDLNDTVKSILGDLEVLIQDKKAKITVNELPKVEGIPILIHQLFMNLINNALKFSKETPRVTINWERVRKDHLMFAEITVADNGIGFEEEDVMRIFETFTRLHSKDKFEGSGLGLSLCKRIVDRHDGFIYATGNKNKGATFTVLLPFTQKEKQE
jgi:PAS domain S-box-containing protein